MMDTIAYELDQASRRFDSVAPAEWGVISGTLVGAASRLIGRGELLSGLSLLRVWQDGAEDRDRLIALGTAELAMHVDAIDKSLLALAVVVEKAISRLNEEVGEEYEDYARLFGELVLVAPSSAEGDRT